MNVVITGTGSYAPNTVITNGSFNDSTFYDPSGRSLEGATETIIQKFRDITGIYERRYVAEGQKMSDIAALAGAKALQDAGVDAEKLDAIILAHNFGDVSAGSTQIDIMPCIAARVKQALHIANPSCVAFDILFGCPGWVQALIIARQYLVAENAKRILVIGGETLSRVIDPHDRDSMIYADGAAGVVLESRPGTGKGIIATCAQTHSIDEAYYLYYDKSNKQGDRSEGQYLKMHGKKIYEFALKNVAVAMKECLDKSGTHISKLKKIFIHQANEKMDEAILKRFYGLYNRTDIPAHIMPMNIHSCGNTSVASIPTMLDDVLKNRYPDHQLSEGDVILFASVGAGMNINAVTYVV